MINQMMGGTTPPVQQGRPANEAMKVCSILLFLLSFFLTFIGTVTTVIGIGYLILAFAACVSMVAFICLCFI